MRLQTVRAQNPDALEKATGALLRSPDEPVAAIDVWIQRVWPLFAAGNEGNLPYRDTRAIPTLVLALARPDEAIAVYYQVFQHAGKLLLHRTLFANTPLTKLEYGVVLNLAQKIFRIMADEWRWAPRDLWDVQGFIWTTCGGRELSNEVDEPPVDEVETKKVMSPPTNLILYGPPGTGKTYRSAEEAVLLCDGRLPEGDRKAVMTRYRELVERKRIEFVTFHQSYSYEDFVEGLRPETGTVDGQSDGSGGFRLVPRPGIFRNIAERALANRGGAQRAAINLADRQAFKMSLGKSWDDENAYLFDEAIAKGYVLLAYGGEVDWSDARYESFDAIKERWREVDPAATGNDPNIQQTYALRSWMKQGDLVIISDGNMRFRAIGEVTGPYRFARREHDHYYHQRPVKWLWVRPEGLPREDIYDKGFSQVSIYRLKSDQVKWAALEELVSSASRGDVAGVPEPYVLVIDEINRANISKVFGELITLIEPDKRLGADNALTVTLPYSGTSFGVPPNLHILGTMNTADRSIALLDTALRRRFRFKELMPEPDLLPQDLEGLDLMAALRGLNARIEYFFDRDHQIGHAYFIHCRSRADLEVVMRDRVIPLLVEYFYENWEKVRGVLNETADDGAFIVRSRLSGPAPRNGEGSAEERWRYAVRPTFSPDAFRQLAP